MDVLKINVAKRVAVSIALFLFCVLPSGAQVSWGPAVDVAAASFGNNRPRIVTAANGAPLIIWGNSAKVMFTRWNGAGFSTPVQLNPVNVDVAEASWMGPDIAAHGDTVYVVYKQKPESDTANHIWCVRSFDGGLSFDAPVRVDFIADSISRFPTVTTDEMGNPIVGFMKFAPSFGEARWVVTKSTDFGMSFMPDVLASGWSSATSEVCDCCPGQITNADGTTVMLYRDNNSDIRDCWAGISNDNGGSFTAGINIDQQNWIIAGCPSTGPDGVIIGDTLYSTFMSAGSGNIRVYYSKSSVSSMTGASGIQITNNFPGLAQQNFPRIANAGNSMAIVWMQVADATSQLALSFTENIANGLPQTFETVATDNVVNGDVALIPGEVFAVWQDDVGVVKFRSGSYSLPTFVTSEVSTSNLHVYPNPAENCWIISGNSLHGDSKLELLDMQGKVIYARHIAGQSSLNHKIENAHLASGSYFIKVTDKEKQFSIKCLKQ